MEGVGMINNKSITPCKKLNIIHRAFSDTKPSFYPAGSPWDETERVWQTLEFRTRAHVLGTLNVNCGGLDLDGRSRVAWDMVLKALKPKREFAATSTDYMHPTKCVSSTNIEIITRKVTKSNCLKKLSQFRENYTRFFIKDYR
jgi:hypothetical protein